MEVRPVSQNPPMFANKRISDRATEIFCGMPSKDLGRACGLAAAEILDG